MGDPFDRSKRKYSVMIVSRRNVAILGCVIIATILCSVGWNSGHDVIENSTLLPKSAGDSVKHSIAVEHDLADWNWYDVHQNEGKHALQRIESHRKSETTNDHIEWTSSDTLPSWPDLADQLRVLTETRGLVIMGDSIARFLYVAALCLVTGMYDDDTGLGDECNNYQAKLKQQCNGKASPCNASATSPNSTRKLGLLCLGFHGNYGDGGY